MINCKCHDGPLAGKTFKMGKGWVPCPLVADFPRAGVRWSLKEKDNKNIRHLYCFDGLYPDSSVVRITYAGTVHTLVQNGDEQDSNTNAEMKSH
jgi:hypothetical protein